MSITVHPKTFDSSLIELSVDNATYLYVIENTRNFEHFLFGVQHMILKPVIWMMPSGNINELYLPDKTAKFATFPGDYVLVCDINADEAKKLFVEHVKCVDLLKKLIKSCRK